MGTGTWVPLATAAAGLIAGLAAGLVSTILARRWAREDRAAAWQREDAQRWHADRLQTYTRMIAALEAWTAALRQVEATCADAGRPPRFDAAEWDRHDQATRDLMAQLRLMAPKEVTGRAAHCRLVFGQLRLRLDAGDADLAKILAAHGDTAQATRALVEAMRADLGLGGDRQSAPG